MNDSKERKSGVILSYASIAVNTLIQLLYTPLLIRMLGQSEYGLYSLVASIIGYLTIMDLGFGNAIIVYTAKYRAQGKTEEEKKLHGMFNLVFLIIGVVAALIGLVLFFNVNAIFGNKMSEIELNKMQIMMLILSFNLFITFSFAIYSSIISAYEKFTFQKVIAIIQSILKPLLMVPLLFLGFKSITLCVVITIANLITVLSNYIYCKKKLDISVKYNGFDKKLFKIIFSYSIWIFLGVIVDKVNWNVDQVLIGIFSGTISISRYSVASQINQMYIMFSTAISGVLLPKASKMIALGEENKKINDFFVKTGRIQLIIIGLILSGFIVFGYDFIILWVGNDFSESYVVALALMIPMVVSLIQNSATSIVQAKNKFKFMSIVLVIISIINILISIPLIINFGALGAAIGTAISLFIGNIVIKNIYYHKIIKLDIINFFKEMLPISLFIIMITSIFLLILKHLNLINGWISLFALIIVYVICYSIGIFQFMNEYEKGFIRKIFKKLGLIKND